MNKNKKGFTLIELLVVISIISLLSSVILSSVQDARNKAKDKAIISQLYNMRLAIESLGSDSGEYGSSMDPNDCDSFWNDPKLYDFGVQNNWPAVGGIGSALPSCYSNGTAWGVITAFSLWHPTTNGGWCFDNKGNSVSMATAPNADSCVGGGGGSTPTNYTLTIKMTDTTGTGWGTIHYWGSVSGSCDTPNTCTISVPGNTTVNMTVQTYGSTFLGYGFGACYGGPSNCTFIMNGDKTVDAAFQ